MPSIPSQRFSPLASSLFAALMVLIFAVSPAIASTTAYLRPNGDITTSEPWSIVGASKAWEALDDNVTELETPNNEDYISTAKVSPAPSTKVELSTLSLAGQTPLSASAWFYTSTSSSVTLTVAAEGDHSEGSQTFSGSGWHSFSVPFSLNQNKLNTLSMKFAPTSGSGTRQISAALVRLSIEPPAHSIYWGSWIDGDVYGREGDAPWDATTWTLFNNHATRAPSLVHFGQLPPWLQEFKEQPLSFVINGNNTVPEEKIAGGAIPLMDMSSKEAALEGLSQGKYDPSLKEWASAVAKYGKPFFFRWDWEMNGKWFPWGKEAASDPERYVKVWQRFHAIAEEQGATNITWVWCPNVLFEGSTSLASLYPGDAYVDWTCMDGYNRGTKTGETGDAWKSFASIFKTTYLELLKLAPSKPIMVGETASTESGGSKAGWIEDTFGTQLPSKFPSIKAVAWFNWNIYEEKNKVTWDWPIESSSSAQDAFANIISSPYYAANEFESLTPLKPIQPLP